MAAQSPQHPIQDVNGNAAGGGAALPPIYTDLDRTGSTLDPNPARSLIKVPEGFFAADHPNTKLMVNLFNHGDLPRLKLLLDRNVGSSAIFQIADRGYKGNSKSMFHKQAILYLSLTGMAVYFNNASIVSIIVGYGGSSLLRSQFASGVESEDDILTFPTEYIGILMESFHCLVPLLKFKYWNPYETTCLLYRRRYLQCRTPILGYPDLLRYALVRSANYNLTGFFSSVKRETNTISLSRLNYLGSIMVQHFNVDLAAGIGTRMVFEAANGPRYVMPNLCSVSRRLLTLLAYQDPNGRLISQVLGALRECANSEAYHTSLPDDENKRHLLFWLQDVVSFEYKSSGLFRSLGQATESLLVQNDSNELREHYQRYDSLNCISLLLSLLTHNDPAVVPDPLGFGRRLLDAACAIAVQSGLVDPLVNFAWPDHMLALGSLINPIELCVQFDQFARFIAHVPLYVKTLATSGLEMRRVECWRVKARRSVLRLDWNNPCNEMLHLMLGLRAAPLVTDLSTPPSEVLISQEQAADKYNDAIQQDDVKRSFDYGAFYRKFEHRYRMWACCSTVEPDLRPRAIVFREDMPFSAALFNTERL